MKRSKMPLNPRKISIAAVALMLAGCAYHVRLDNAAELMQRADFDAAVKAAPEWVEEALLTINDLELEIERR